MRAILGAIKAFNKRMVEDHMGAYAATCAYFIILSFVPFVLIFIAISRRTDLDSTTLMNAIIQVIPSGLKSYVQTIISEVYRKPSSTLPISLVILIWSAAKAFHALTNGLNVISKVKETRGWFYTRFRSMLIVILLLASIMGIINILVYWREVVSFLEERFPELARIVTYLYDFRTLVGYLVLLFVFLCVYKFLPTQTYTFRSQLPGALIVTTVWTFFSYLMTVYYEHSKSFLQTYGSLTGIVLAMIWLYFCMYFVLVGAELNRVMYEDPEHNIIVDAIDDYMAASQDKRDKLEAQIRMENDIASRRQAMATGDLPKELNVETAEANEKATANEKPAPNDKTTANEKPTPNETVKANEKSRPGEKAKANEKPRPGEKARAKEKPEVSKMGDDIPFEEDPAWLKDGD